MHVIQSRSAAEAKNLFVGIGSLSFAENEILRFATQKLGDCFVAAFPIRDTALPRTAPLAGQVSQ